MNSTASTSSGLSVHGPTIAALRGSGKVLLITNGYSSIYGSIGAVMCGVLTDYDKADKRLKKYAKRMLRASTTVTAQNLAEEARLELVTCEERSDINTKAVILFSSGETIWIASRNGCSEFAGDFIAEGSGGHIFESFLAVKDYSSSWTFGKIIGVAKRAMLCTLADQASTIVKIVQVTNKGAEILLKASATELAICEEEPTLQEEEDNE